MEPALAPLLEPIRRFVREDLAALEPDLLARPFRTLLPALAEKRAEVKRRGWWTPHLPKEKGGLGLTLPEFGRLSEELGWSPVGHYLFNCAAPDIGNMELLLAHGTPEQQERWIVPVMRGEKRSCFSMTEPEHAGSNPVMLSTRALKDGPDYVIDGHKWFTSSADGAAFAVVMAVTDPEAPPHRRASMIIVPTDTPGFRLVRNISVNGHAGEDWYSHGEVRYEACRVPQSNRIGAEGAGFALAQERLGPGRIHHCMRWIGVAERALDMTVRRAITREIAPGKLLATRQSVQHGVAESRAEIDAARLLVLHAAEAIEERGASAARVEVSTIKFYVANVLDRVLDRAVQAHGALGVTDDTVLSLYARQERSARIYDGPDEVHRSVVARHIFKAYGVQVEP